MESKHQNVAILRDAIWLIDLAFLTNITQHLSELNVKVQGKSQLVNRLFEHICAFDEKFKLLHVQMGRATLTNFTCLAVKKKELHDLCFTNYAASAQELRDELTSRFPKFRWYEIKAKSFAHPLDLAVEDSPDDCQMELIELWAEVDNKRGYSENSLVIFYKFHVCGKFQNLSRHARKFISLSLFGSTNCCEQFY